MRMSEIQIQHLELDESSNSSSEESDRKLQGPIQVTLEDNVNRVVSMK